jgi:adenylate cyclase
MKAPGMKFKLRMSLSAIFLILTIPSFIGFLAYSYSNNFDIYKGNADRDLVQHNDDVAEKLTNLLNPIDDSIKVIRKQLTDDPTLFNNTKFIETLALHLANNHNLVSIFTASIDGTYRQVTSVVGPGVILSDRVPPTGSIMAVWKVDRAKNQKEAISEYAFYKTPEPFDSIGAFEVKNNYDPRTRPFYTNILKTMETKPDGNFIQIDPVYIAASSKKPTLSATTPVMLGGALIGWHSQSFALESIAKFLSTSRISSNSEAFIIDETGTILVRTKFDQGFTVEKGTFKPRKLSEFVGTPLPFLAAEHLKMNEKGREKDREKIIHFAHGPDKKDYIAKFTPIKNDFGKHWEVMTLAPMEDFLEPLNQINKKLIIFAALLSLLSMLIYFYLSRIVSRPIELITLDIKRLLEFNLEPGRKDTRSLIDEISILSDAVRKLKNTLNAFTSYVPRDLVNDLLKSGKEIEIGGESRYLTILFSDLEDFSGLSEVTPSRDLLKRVSSYLELMTFAIKEENGTVDKFIGDAVMAFWGAPLINQHHGYLACVAAIKSKRRMTLLNEGLIAENKRPLKVRIGIHSDAVLVGNIGSPERLSYTVMGDGVNVASRLEGVNKEFGTAICVSHAVFKEAGERLRVRPIDQIMVKGRKGEILIYELMGILDGSEETMATARENELCDLTTKAFELYTKGEFQAAAILYTDIDTTFDDPLACTMAAKCMDLHKAKTATL